MAGGIRWEQFWERAGEEKRSQAATGQYGQADPLAAFVQQRGCESVCSVGCGPAHVLFDLAERFPEREFVGIDVATSVIEQNRSRTELENLEFAVDSLPRLDIDRRFDLVICYGVLPYVEASERAVVSLYEVVSHGGALVFDYPSREMPNAIRRAAADSDDPEWMRDRFRLVLARSNLLSYDRIHELTGRWPRKFNADGEVTGSRASPRVVVPK